MTLEQKKAILVIRKYLNKDFDDAIDIKSANELPNHWGR